MKDQNIKTEDNQNLSNLLNSYMNELILVEKEEQEIIEKERGK